MTFLNADFEEDTVTKSELLEVRNGTRPIVVCEECQQPYARKRRDQRFCSSRCAGKFNAKREYGPTGKASPIEDDVAAAQWIATLPRPIQPFTPDEIKRLATLLDLPPATVEGIAWLTTLKLETAL